MNYIINPAWFYWLSVADSFRSILITGLVICLSLIVICGIASSAAIAAVNDWPNISEGERKRFPIYNTIFKVAIIASPFFAIAIIFAPSKSTLIEMMVAKFATYENANWTLETIKSAVNYIIDAINSMK